MAINQPQYETFGSGLAEGLSKGLQQQFIEPEQERRKAKLQLAMESAMVQQRMAAQTIPQNEFNQISGGLGNMFGSLASGQAPGQLNLQGITSPAGQQAALGALGQGLSSVGRSGGFIPVHGVDPNTGQPMITPMNRRTGKLGESQTGGGVTGATADRVIKARAGYLEAGKILDDVQSTLSPVLSKVMSDLPKQYATMKLNDLAQQYPEIKAYVSSIPATTQRLGVALTGGIGADRSSTFLNSQSQELPDPYRDTAATALAKVHRMKGLFRNRYESEIKAIGGSLPAEQSQQGLGLNVGSILERARQLQGNQ